MQITKKEIIAVVVITALLAVPATPLISVWWYLLTVPACFLAFFGALDWR